MAKGDGRRLIFGRWGFWLAMVGVVTVLAGILFGYDQGVISGALVGIKADFGLSTNQVEVVTSWVTLGALVGALIAGVLADRLGRKTSGILAGALFAVGAATQALSPGFAVLVVGRFVIGTGVGVASVAAPLYAAEMAPTRSRGRYVSTYQLAITIGIFLAYLIDAVLVSEHASHPSNTVWRAMLGIAVIPGVLLVAAMATVPRSPYWLVKVGRRDEARVNRIKVRGEEGADEYLDEIEAQIEKDRASQVTSTLRDLLAPHLRKALWVGLGLALIQQITGINAVIYYADEIFDEAGFRSATASADATLLAVGAVNVLATFIAIGFVDRLGRRPLLFAGLAGMTVSLSSIGLAFMLADNADTTRGASLLGILTLVGLIVFIASFAFSLGPIVWTIINEIYPSQIRGRAVALATAVNWGSAFLVSQFFLSIVDALGEGSAFLLFALCSVLGGVRIWFKVPETRGLPLTRVHEVWTADDPRRKAIELIAEQDRAAAQSANA